MAKVMISLPDELLERIDKAAERRKLSRSAFVREATEREIRRDPELVDAAIARARAAMADLGPFDSAELVRADRDWRDARGRSR